MTEVVRPGAGLIFMKVGTHAGEDLKDIIARKRREIEEAGFGLWGYGGNTCHPLRVREFAREYEVRSGVIYLCMHRMESHHRAAPKRATEYSADGVNWQTVPAAINVLGSRYALAITDLHEESFLLPLQRTRVAVGASVGRRGDLYVQGRVDKGCLEVLGDTPTRDSAEAAPLEIGLLAQLVEPYAVLLR